MGRKSSASIVSPRQPGMEGHLATLDRHNAQQQQAQAEEVERLHMAKTSFISVGREANSWSHGNRPLIDTRTPPRYTRTIPPQLAAPGLGRRHRGGPPHG